MAFAQAGYYESVGLPLVRTREDLEGHLRSGGLAAVLLMEGADPVEDPADLRRWVERGVRIVGPAWAGTRYSGGTRAPGGLTELGHGLLRAMRRQRVVLDLSHMAEQAVRDAFAVWRGPVIASHSNARALLPGDRQVSDETAAEIGRRGGVIGVSFFQRHLTKRKQASLDDVARHVFHLATAAGGPEHVGIGSDLDGGFQATEAPLRDLSELAGLGPLLRRRLSATQVEGVLGGNWIEFLRRSLPA
jgi:membrane dipeptidase